MITAICQKENCTIGQKYKNICLIPTNFRKKVKSLNTQVHNQLWDTKYI